MSDISQDNIVLVDGHHLLFRMFYGVQSKIRAVDGQLINAVLGFVSATLKYAKMFDAKYMLVIFDSECGSFRTQLESQYKANRTDDFSIVADDDNPFLQLPIIEKVLDYMSIAHCESGTMETDDIIATCTQRYNCHHTYIISGDSDLLQLVTDNTTVYMDRGKLSVTYVPSMVKQRFGVIPQHIIDYKCLVGDTSDNIAGISGIGPKTACRLIDSYGNIDDIIHSVDRITPQRLSDSISSNIDRLAHNKQLITLRNDAQLPFALQQLAVNWDRLQDVKAIEILRCMGYIK